MKKNVVAAAFIILAVLMLSSFTASNGKILADGTYDVKVAFEGGTGKARILPDAVLDVKGDSAWITVTWNSKNYDYMLVDDVKYLHRTPGGYSTFYFPVKELDKPMDVTGDTLAMSRPREIDYVITISLAE